MSISNQAVSYLITAVSQDKKKTVTERTYCLKANFMHDYTPSSFTSAGSFLPLREEKVN